MQDATILSAVRNKYIALLNDLDERARRRWAATEAQVIGYGGIALVAKATGLSDRTIRNGIQEINADLSLSPERQRKPGAGRKPHSETQPELQQALDQLINPATRGSPMNPLRWTSKSVQQLAVALQEQKFVVSATQVRRMLKKMGYSLQANRKTREGRQHPDRNAQFEFLNERVKARRRRGEPAISVDTKKKEVLGNLKNTGKTYEPKGRPREVNTHDFPDKAKGKAVPYGVYDIHNNDAGVSVGMSHDTAEFAVQAIRRWWNKLGRKRYRRAKRMLITADSGGSNSSRSRLWKVELQQFADETGMILEVCHYPPGTSKWNKIEHRLFCHITRNWRGVPLETLEVVVESINATTTTAGLEVHAWLDSDEYKKWRKVSDAELDACDIRYNSFHGEWNYEIHPRRSY